MACYGSEAEGIGRGLETVTAPCFQPQEPVGGLAPAQSHVQSTTITILGVDEADSAQGQVSWVAPVARALIKARVGDVVRLAVPGGAQELEVLAVDYPAPAA